MPNVQASSVRGLSAADAVRRLAADGPNELPVPRRTATWKILAGQLTHLFALMLWVAAGLALAAGLAPLAVAIVVIIVLNGVFAFAQEYRADRAAERLRDLLPARVQVIRDGEVTSVDATQLVRDDLVVLSAGDRVSADLRLVTVHALAVDESMLTGESVPVRPSSGRQVFAGTYVVQGEADAVVTAVAGNTRLAGIQSGPAGGLPRCPAGCGPAGRRLAVLPGLAVRRHRRTHAPPRRHVNQAPPPQM